MKIFSLIAALAWLMISPSEAQAQWWARQPVKCPDGTFQPTPGICIPAAPGSFVPPGGAGPVPCPPGTFSPNSGAAACIQTPPGSFAPSGSPGAFPCQPGSFAPGPGMPACIKSPPGTYVATFGGNKHHALPNRSIFDNHRRDEPKQLHPGTARNLCQ